MRSPAISPALTLTTLNKVSLRPWVDSVQPWMCTFGSGSTPASFGTSWYALVTYTLEGGSLSIPQRSGCSPRISEDPGEVGGVLMLLEVEVELLVTPDIPMGKSGGGRVLESPPCAWSGRT